MEFYEDGDDIVSVWNPSSHFQSWANTLHGGIQAALIDEIAEWVVNRKLQTTGVTTNLEVRYKKPVMMTGKPITLRAHLIETRHRLAFIEVSLYNDEGVLCFVGKLTYAFSAKERDAETGLSYFGARYYSSDLSVWLSVDPMADKYPSLSPYVYCADNPVKLVDPEGMQWETADDEKKA